MSKIVIALGGNALGKTPSEQLRLVKQTALNIVDIIKEGHTVVIAHGNGPQVGIINLAFENASKNEFYQKAPLFQMKYFLQRSFLLTNSCHLYLY